MTRLTVNTATILSPLSNLTATNDIVVLVAPFGGTPTQAQAILVVQGAITLSATARTGNPVTGGFQGTAMVVGPSTSLGTRVQIDPSGTIRANSSVTAEDSPAIGIWSAPGASYILAHAGTIEVTSAGAAVGVHHAAANGAGLTLGNTGTIRAVSSGGSAMGLDVAAVGFVNTGVVEATGATAAIGARIDGYNSSFVNRGSVVADATASGDSIGVLWISDRIGGGDFFENLGRIEADVALKVDVVGGATSQRFTNSGVMVGRVELGRNADEFVNAGQVQGDISLGAGDDSYVGVSGTTSGLVSGGDGADRLRGGVGFDYLQGNTGNDTAQGGEGDDWVLGGKDHDALFGDTGSDIVYGNIGNDSCDGGDGADTIRGGQNDDVLTGGAGNDWLSGDRGDDTVTGGAGADLFHTFGDAGLDRVTDFNAAEGDRVLLDPGTQYTVAQVGADTVITMTGGGQMILVGVSQASLSGDWLVVG